LTPPRHSERFLKAEDPFGAGAAAWRMAGVLGLEETVARCKWEPAEDLGAEWNRVLIERLCLVSRAYWK
jgi:hypothetical protein